MRLSRRETPETRRFYDLIWPHAPTALRTARILTGSATEAEDLMQEALLKAFKSLASFQEGTDAKAWLLAILRNTRIDRLRIEAHRGKPASLEREPPAPAEPEPADGAWESPQEILNAFSDQEVIEGLQQLPEEIRWTLLLVDVEQMPQRDAAELLGVPEGTIKSRAHRGRQMLRTALLPLAKDRRLVRE